MTSSTPLDPSGLNDPLDAVARFREVGRRAAWAVVVRTWGSSPRPAGSRLAVAESGEFFGSVSGGCVEGAVVTEALAILAGGPPKLLHFGVSHEEAWEVGLACGGEVEVYVSEVPALFEELRAARAAKRPVVLATRLATGEAFLLDRLNPSAGAGVTPELLTAARACLEKDACAVAEGAAGAVFLEPFNPPLRLVIVGAVHIAHPLARLAGIAGFEVVVVDPRTAFTLPGVARSTLWPDEALAEIRPDRRTAIVTLTHDPKLDDPALAAALSSDAFFIGCKNASSRNTFSPESLPSFFICASLGRTFRYSSASSRNELVTILNTGSHSDQSIPRRLASLASRLRFLRIDLAKAICASSVRCRSSAACC